MTETLTLTDELREKLRQYADRVDLDGDNATVGDVIHHLLDNSGKTDEAVEAARERAVDSYEAGDSDDATLAERQSDSAHLSAAESREAERQRQRLREKYVKD